METSKEIMQMRHKTLWKWHRSPLQRMGIMQCICYTTAPASSSSLPTRGIKYISRDISSQCLGQKHNSTDVASVTSLPSRDSPGKVDPKCVSSHCLCLLNASRCETSGKKKGQKRTCITEPEFSIQLHISLICDNGAATQNLWIFGRKFQRFWSARIFCECDDDTSALRWRVLQTALWHYTC